MITGTTSWTNALNAQKKKALYYLEIVGQSSIFASFVASAESITAPAGKTFKPYLFIPQGPSQTIDELTGHVNISSFDLECVDPNGELKALASIPNLGTPVAKLWMGFEGNAITDFLTLHQGRVTRIGRGNNGRMVVTIGDFVQDLVDQVFINGGPIATGYVNINGTAVTWLKGTQFRTDGGWTGAAISFGSNPNIVSRNIASVTDSEDLVLSSSLSVLNNVTCIVPKSGIEAVVDVNGHTVTWGGGDTFQTGTSWNGAQILINGNSYTISSVSSSTVLTLVQDVGVQNNVPYYTTGTTALGDPAQPKIFPPFRPMWSDNGYPVSSDNPRTIAGNPMEILLMVIQNELGLGQSTPPVLVVENQGGSGAGIAGYSTNPAWQMYVMGNDATLINPNPYVDVPGILALRDSVFSGDVMTFKLTDTESGKSWIEDEILKPLGMFWITRASGQLALKSMKPPSSTSGRTLSLNDHAVIGIPSIDRWPVVNIVNPTAQLQPDGQDDMPLSPFADQTSLNDFTSPSSQSLDSKGLSPCFGAEMRLYSTAARIFKRHGYATPVYEIKAQLRSLPLEVGDFIPLTHPKLPDLQSGAVGVTDVLCEVIERQPDYSKAMMTFKAIDTRFITFTQPVQIAPGGSVNTSSSGNAVTWVSGEDFTALSVGGKIVINGTTYTIATITDNHHLALAASPGNQTGVTYCQVPDYTNATSGERAQYMFISSASLGGENPDHSPGNEIW